MRYLQYLLDIKKINILTKLVFVSKEGDIF